MGGGSFLRIPGFPEDSFHKKRHLPKYLFPKLPLPPDLVVTIQLDTALVCLQKRRTVVSRSGRARVFVLLIKTTQHFFALPLLDAWRCELWHFTEVTMSLNRLGFLAVLGVIGGILFAVAIVFWSTQFENMPQRHKSYEEEETWVHILEVWSSSWQSLMQLSVSRRISGGLLRRSRKSLTRSNLTEMRNTKTMKPERKVSPVQNRILTSTLPAFGSIERESPRQMDFANSRGEVFTGTRQDWRDDANER